MKLHLRWLKSNFSIKLLINSYDWLLTFQWHVTVIQNTFQGFNYRQSAHTQNTKHEKQFIIDLTFFDGLSNLSEDDSLWLEQYVPSQTEVATQYYGTRAVNPTMPFKTPTAIRLPSFLIESIRKIFNG